MGILSPLVWPLYKSGVIVPLFGILIFIYGVFCPWDLILKMVIIIIGFLLIIDGVILVIEKKKVDNYFSKRNK